MKSNQNQFSKTSRSTQPMRPASAASSSSPSATIHPVHPVGSPRATTNPSVYFVRPRPRTSFPSLNHGPLPPHLSGYASTSTAKPSPVLPMGTPSTRHTTMPPPPPRPSPPQSSSAPQSRGGNRSIPSKRAWECIPGPPRLPPQDLPVGPSSERPAKRQRLYVGHPNTPTPQGGSQPQQEDAPARPDAQSSTQPPSSEGGPVRPNRHSESPGSGHPLKEEPKEAVGRKVSEKVADLMWVRQNRIGAKGGRSADPVVQVPGMAILYGPAPQYVDPTLVNECLQNPDIIVLDDDEDDGFEKVLDLYRGAVFGSALPRELKPRPSGPSYSGHALRTTRTLEGHKQVVEEADPRMLSKPTTAKEEPPLGIEWSYSCCDYAVGKVVNSRKATATPTGDAQTTSAKKRKRHQRPAWTPNDAPYTLVYLPTPS